MQPHQSNLLRWEQSGEPRHWVTERGGTWNHEDWLALLSRLEMSPYWPLEPDEVGGVLERTKRDYFVSKEQAATPALVREPAAEQRSGSPDGSTPDHLRAFAWGQRIAACCTGLLGLALGIYGSVMNARAEPIPGMLDARQLFLLPVLGAVLGSLAGYLLPQVLAPREHFDKADQQSETLTRFFCLFIGAVCAAPVVLMAGYFLFAGKDGVALEASHVQVMEARVAAFLRKSGIQGGATPKVELQPVEKGKWEGTADYGEVVYELKVKAAGRGFEVERRQRPRRDVPPR